MSKNRRRYRSKSSRKRKGSKDSPSWIIPVVAGVVVAVVLVGVLVSLAIQESTVASESSGSVPTLTALAAQPIPNPGVARIPLEKAVEQVEQGQAVLIDVRSQAAFEKAHAAGAISMPESEIKDRLEELPRDRDLVLY